MLVFLFQGCCVTQCKMIISIGFMKVCVCAAFGERSTRAWRDTGSVCVLPDTCQSYLHLRGGGGGLVYMLQYTFNFKCPVDWRRLNILYLKILKMSLVCSRLQGSRVSFQKCSYLVTLFCDFMEFQYTKGPPVLHNRQNKNAFLKLYFGRGKL